MAEPVTILVILRIKAEHRQEIFDYMNTKDDGIALTRKHKGCVSIEGRMSTDDDETIVLWEKWSSKEEQADYLKMREDSGFFQRVFDGKSVASPVIHFLSVDSF